MKYKIGDVFEYITDFDVFIHGCNCQCRMRKGIAGQVLKIWPEVQKADLNIIKGDVAKLETLGVVAVPGLFVVNAYIQYYFWMHGQEKRRLVDYEALSSCFKEVKIKFSGKKIVLPKIGAGLAGGDWKLIEEIINVELADEDVTVFELKEMGL